VALVAYADVAARDHRNGGTSLPACWMGEGGAEGDRLCKCRKAHVRSQANYSSYLDRFVGGGGAAARRPCNKYVCGCVCVCVCVCVCFRICAYRLR
jgi:hypothetical protein